MMRKHVDGIPAVTPLTRNRQYVKIRGRVRCLVVEFFFCAGFLILLCRRSQCQRKSIVPVSAVRRVSADSIARFDEVGYLGFGRGLCVGSRMDGLALAADS